MTSLLVIAHPDDETIFFGGLLAETAIQAKTPKSWHVVCVTDGSGDGRAGERASEFAQACKRLGVERWEQLDFADTPHARLDVDRLMNRLARFDVSHYERVYTHGIIGEYGHNHHQDVSYATHMTFAKRVPVFSQAYNIFPDEGVVLSERSFRLKTDVMWTVYKKEVQRFLNMLPATAYEGFARVDVEEVSAIYRLLAHNETLQTHHLKHYLWLQDYLNSGAMTQALQLFLGNYLQQKR